MGGTTTDHIISRNLFVNPSQVDLSKFRVPACLTCNRDISGDEEFFRNFITTLALGSSPSARNLFATKIQRATHRRPALSIDLFKKMRLVDLHTVGGIYLGQRTMLPVDSQAKGRINRVLIKYARGLFYKHFGIPTPEKFTASVGWPNQIEGMEVTAKIKPNGRLGGVFAYGHGCVEGTHNSAWRFLFYEKIPFMVFLVDESVRTSQVAPH